MNHTRAFFCILPENTMVLHSLDVFFAIHTHIHVTQIWPPLDYDPMAPLALPLGPKSLAMRNMLAAEVR